MDSSPLTTARGAALYIGALLGPGLLLLPGLAARTAGPASVVAWIALLGLSALFACVFAALGRGFPSAGGVMGYVSAGLGDWAGQAAGWSFLAGVISGAPIVCIIGAGYVTAVIGTFRGPGEAGAQAIIAGLLLLVVLALAAGGLRSSATAQLLLVALLIVVVTVAVSGSARMARAANWAPFAPHGWAAVGHAAALLMLSFVGWEAVAPLTTRFRDPRRQLTRVIVIALAVTTAIYLGLAITVIGVLGPDAGSSIPLAGLLKAAIGSAGPAVAAVAAVILTLGATNSYITGASAMVGMLPPLRAGRAGAVSGEGFQARPGARRSLLVTIAAIGFPLIALYGAGLISVTPLVAIPTTLFLSVYLGCMVAAIRLLRGLGRVAAVPAAVAVAALLLFCGWALTGPALVALVTAIHRRRGRAAHGEVARREVTRRAGAVLAQPARLGS
jgi:amino acid efflux transporter